MTPYQIAVKAGTEAGNRSMADAGRTVWSVDDWNAAANAFDRARAEAERLDRHRSRRTIDVVPP